MLPDLSTALWGLIGTILGGGGVWAFLSAWTARITAKEEGEIGRLREDVKALRTELKDCETRHEVMEGRVVGLEQAQDSHIARWIKNANREMIWCNAKAYLTIFAPLGYTRDDIQGKTFAQLDRFDRQACEEIDRLDLSALAREGLASSTLIRLHPLLPLMHVVKVAAAGRDGSLIFEGYAYRGNDGGIADGLGAARMREAIQASAEHVIDRTTSEVHARGDKSGGGDKAP